MSEQLFEELADNAPVMIWRSGTDKLCDFFNKPWLQYTGRTHQEEMGLGWTTGVHPDDFDRCLAVYAAAFDRRDTFSMEYRLQRHDGAYRWILDNGRPFERDGTFAGYFGSCIDIHERRELEDTRKDLIGELNHRVKNMLSTVQALARQSLSGVSSPKEAEKRLTIRLMALSRVQELLAENGWRGADMRLIAESALQLTAPADDRGVVEGPNLLLVPGRTQLLAMTLTELGLNALQHGAWSSDKGHVQLRYELIEGERLSIQWQEHGGPPVSEPTRRGFGMRLLQGMLPSEAGGQASVEFRPEGLVCRIILPLAATAGGAPEL